MPQARAKLAKYYIGTAGQSLNYAPQQPNGGANDYLHQLMAYYPNCISSAEPVTGHIAQSGTPWSTLLLNVYPKLKPRGKSAPTSILIMNGGTSDYGNGNDGATVYQTCSDYADAARSYGFDIIIFTTTTPSNGLTGINETNRVAGNILCMADANSKFDYKIDVAADPSLSNSGNTTYYGDGVHFTTAGATVMMGLVKTVLDTIIPVADR